MTDDGEPMLDWEQLTTDLVDAITSRSSGDKEYVTDLVEAKTSGPDGHKKHTIGLVESITSHPNGQKERTTDLVEAITSPPDSHKEQTPSLPLCTHSMPPAVRAKLSKREMCPACLIEYHIKTIEDIQSRIEHRGGIFISQKRSAVLAERKEHRALMKLWKIAKIECYEDIQALERLFREQPWQANICGVSKALENWQVTQDLLVRVPGYSYIGETEEADVGVGTISPLSRKEMQNLTLEDQDTSAPQSENGYDDTQPPSPPSESLTKAKNLVISPSIVPKQDLDDLFLSEMEGFTSRLDQRTDMGNWDMFGAIAGKSAAVSQEDTTIPAIPSIPTTPPNNNICKTSIPATEPPRRSALKGDRASHLSSPRTTKFAEVKTVIPDFSGPSAMRNLPKLAEHSKQTTSEAARPRRAFHRTTPFYQAATWASPKGYEKQDTSFLNMPWSNYELSHAVSVFQGKAQVRKVDETKERVLKTDKKEEQVSERPQQKPKALWATLKKRSQELKATEKKVETSKTAEKKEQVSKTDEKRVTKGWKANRNLMLRQKLITRDTYDETIDKQIARRNSPKDPALGKTEPAVDQCWQMILHPTMSTATTASELIAQARVDPGGDVFRPIDDYLSEDMNGQHKQVVLHPTLSRSATGTASAPTTGRLDPHHDVFFAEDDEGLGEGLGVGIGELKSER